MPTKETLLSEIDTLATDIRSNFDRYSAELTRHISARVDPIIAELTRTKAELTEALSKLLPAEKTLRQLNDVCLALTSIPLDHIRAYWQDPVEPAVIEDEIARLDSALAEAPDNTILKAQKIERQNALKALKYVRIYSETAAVTPEAKTEAFERKVAKDLASTQAKLAQIDHLTAELATVEARLAEIERKPLTSGDEGVITRHLENIARLEADLNSLATSINAGLKLTDAQMLFHVAGLSFNSNPFRFIHRTSPVSVTTAAAEVEVKTVETDDERERLLAEIDARLGTGANIDELLKQSAELAKSSVSFSRYQRHRPTVTIEAPVITDSTSDDDRVSAGTAAGADSSDYESGPDHSARTTSATRPSLAADAFFAQHKDYRRVDLRPGEEIPPMEVDQDGNQIDTACVRDGKIVAMTL